MVPTTASQIVDNDGAVWTIASNAILRNGTSAAGGYGTIIYWKNSTIYVYGTDNNWWQWTGSGWSNLGPTQPGTTTPPTTTASPDGTMVPTTASQIVDNSGAVWTIGSNLAILRNGTSAGGGYGSRIYWKNSTIYVYGTDSNWWQWTGFAWTNVGSNLPGATASLSPDGTMVPTTASQIVDNSGAVWTIGSDSAILRNGTSAAGAYGSKIYWKNSTIYMYGTDGNWWQWTGSGWSNVGPTQPGTTSTQNTSPDGTMVPTTASQIVDNSGAVWTMTLSGSTYAILRNGTSAAGGYGSKIYWKNGSIYVYGTDGNWWQWVENSFQFSGSGWINVGSALPGGGSVSPSGTAVGPQPTITCPAGAVNVFPGASIQDAVNLNGGSTTFCLKSGVHYLSSGITPKTGNTFIGEYGAVLDGTGWTTSDRKEGAFRTISVDVDSVTIRNLIIRNMPQRGIAAYHSSIYSSMSDHWTIEYNEIAFNRDLGVHFVPDTVLRNNYIHHNSFGGYFGDPADNTTLENNEIAYNGYDQKVGESANVTFRNNFIHHNTGTGIWYDWDNTFGLVEGNRVEDNGKTGIHAEVSSDIVIRNNIVRRNGEMGVYISTSKNTQTYNNTLEGNFRGIQYFVGCYALGQGKIGFDLANNSAYDNTITVGTQSGAWASLLSYSSDCSLTQLTPYLNGSKNLTFSHNTYRVPSLANWYWLWGNDIKYWNQWQAIPQDATGTASQYP
jgi:parallel beta-helix repeat protein